MSSNTTTNENRADYIYYTTDLYSSNVKKIPKTNYNNINDLEDKICYEKYPNLPFYEVLYRETPVSLYFNVIIKDINNFDINMFDTFYKICHDNKAIGKLTISGYKIDVSSYTYEYFIQQNGSVEVIDNPLVTTEEHAKQLAQWVADFAAYPKQYTVPYRGDPSVEPMDFIKYETRDRTTPITLVTGYTLNVGQGMDGSFTLKEVKER